MHLDQTKDVELRAQGREECLGAGDRWIDLRQCPACGHVGCCDSSLSLLGRDAPYFRAALSPTGSVQALDVVGA